jgi:hypothetical protein
MGGVTVRDVDVSLSPFYALLEWFLVGRRRTRNTEGLLEGPGRGSGGCSGRWGVGSSQTGKSPRFATVQMEVEKIFCKEDGKRHKAICVDTKKVARVDQERKRDVGAMQDC